MSSREKRASLSSGMLISKDIGSSADAAPASLPNAEAVDGDRRATAELAPPAVLPAAMLSRKGAASAAGFRPEYWSYDRPATPPPAAQPSVVPLFSETPPRAEAAAAQGEAAAAPAEQTRPSVLILGLGCMAVILSTSLFWLSGSGRNNPAAEPPASLAPAPHIAAAHPVEAASPATVAKAVAPAAPEIPAAAPPPAEAVDAAAPPPEKAPATTLSPGEIDSLIARGDQLLATGDIIAARLFFQRAAEQGSGRAATEVGKTYDPLFLEETHVRGVRGDVSAAAEWYRKAAAAGDRQGQIRLDHLTQRFPL